MPKGLATGSKITVTPAKLAANRRNALLASKPGGLLRQLMAAYRARAVEKGLPFLLSEEQCERLFKGNCYYCGQPPARAYRPTRYRTAYVSNGIDRVNNAIGYVFSNCVSCCKTCNQFKSNLTQEEMFSVVVRIYHRHCEGQ